MQTNKGVESYNKTMKITQIHVFYETKHHTIEFVKALTGNVTFFSFLSFFFSIFIIVLPGNLLFFTIDECVKENFPRHLSSFSALKEKTWDHTQFLLNSPSQQPTSTFSSSSVYLVSLLQENNLIQYTRMSCQFILVLEKKIFF
jgi:hypothetical protein